jgi:hypothetical protein
MKPRENCPLLVELAGLPGSGKTAVARAVSVQLRRGNIDCAEETEVKMHRLRLAGSRPSTTPSNARKVFKRMGSMVAAPRLTLACYRVVLNARPLSMDRLRRVDELLSLNRLYEALQRERKHRVIVLDEGVVHQIFSLIFGTMANCCDRAITDVFRRVYQNSNSLVIYFDADPRLCLERFSGRDRGGRFHRDTAPSLKEHFTQSSHYPRIIECLSRAGSARFCTIDASDEVPTVAGKISDRIKELQNG